MSLIQVEEFVTLKDYVRNYDVNSSVNWDKSELLNKEQEVWLEERIHEPMGKPYKKHAPIVISYRWNNPR